MVLHVFDSLVAKLLQIDKMHGIVLLLWWTLMTIALLQVMLNINALVQQLLSSHFVLLLLHLGLIVSSLIASWLRVSSFLLFVLWRWRFLLIILVHNADLRSMISLAVSLVFNSAIGNNHLRSIVSIPITFSFSIALPVNVAVVISSCWPRWWVPSLVMASFLYINYCSCLCRARVLNWMSSTLWFWVATLFLLLVILRIMIPWHIHRVMRIIDIIYFRYWILIHCGHFVDF